MRLDSTNNNQGEYNQNIGHALVTLYFLWINMGYKPTHNCQCQRRRRRLIDIVHCDHRNNNYLGKTNCSPLMPCSHFSLFSSRNGTRCLRTATGPSRGHASTPRTTTRAFPTTCAVTSRISAAWSRQSPAKHGP